MRKMPGGPALRVLMNLYLKRPKKLLKKVLTILGLFLSGALVYSWIRFLSQRFPEIAVLDQPYVAALWMSAMAVILTKPLDRGLTKIFKNYVVQRKHQVHATLLHLAEDLGTVLDLQELGNLVVNTWGEVLHLKTAALFVPSTQRHEFEIISAFGWTMTDSKKVKLPETSPLIELLRSGDPGHIYVRNRVVRALPWHQANRLSHDFVSIRSNWVVPFFIKRDLLGFLGFAVEDPEKEFDGADFQVFRAFAATVAKSIANALKYCELEMKSLQLQDIQSDMLQAAKLQAIEQLATGVAHEIHNPLTIISGKAQVMLLKKDKIGFPDAVEEVLKTIVQQTKRAADITRKLLMFSQGAGHVREPLQLVQVLSDTVALVSYQTSLDNIKVSTSVRGEIPTFWGNVHELREVFLNLILNAVQSIGSQGGKIHCEVNFLEHEQLIEILVLDTGPGIAKDLLPKLFNPFFTTRQGGVGLGLFVTKQIIHRYGGSIRAESRVGEGSLFMIHLPGMTQPVKEPHEVPANV